jgi:formate dehydrogenase alpha subunit
MSTAAKKEVHFKIDGKEITAPDGTVILDVAKRNGIPITNLCSHRNLKPFAACRTCMVEVTDNGKKQLVYSCTHPVAEGMDIRTNTEETARYNGACLEMLLVEHPLDCPICDKSGVCPLQDNTDAMGIYNSRFEIQRRNEPSIKNNPLIEFYLNRCIMCGMCVRVCDEIQGVSALDFHQRGMKVTIGTANHEPLDCEFCGQCITVCPTGALMDMSSDVRGLAALFKNTRSTCNFCSWGCTVQLETKKGRVARIEAIDSETVGINNGNLCAKGRFGHGIIHNEHRLKTPMMNVGGTFKEISWNEAIQTIAERLQSTVNRSGPDSVAGLGSEKLTNEENYLLQKLFRDILGSNQLNNLQNLRAPSVNRFMLNCFANGIHSKPIQKLEEADVALIFHSDLPTEFPVAGNAVRKSAINHQTDILIAHPRDVVFEHRSRVNIRLQFSHGADAVVANRLSRILIDRKLVDIEKIKREIPNYAELECSLAPYTAEYAQQTTGIDDETFTHTAERFGRNADRFILIGNEVLENADAEDVLNALLNLAVLAHVGGQGSVSIYPPREHCNSQGVNDMGLTPEFLPGYQPVSGPLAKQENRAGNLFENCLNGGIKFLYIAGEDPMHSFYKGSLVRQALQTAPFLVVQDVYMTETCKLADIILPTTTYAEKEGTFTNVSRHVQVVNPAVLPEGQSKPDLDIFIEIAEALKKPFASTDVRGIQREIEAAVPTYKGLFPGEQSGQWLATGFARNPRFAPCREFRKKETSPDYPFTLSTNNHMFHVGSFSRYAEALTDIGPECRASVHPDDAEKLALQTGDRIVVQSKTGTIEVPVEISPAIAQGMVHVPKNWAEISINQLRNGEEGVLTVKISKAK